MHLLHEVHLLLLCPMEIQHSEGSTQKRRWVSKLPIAFYYYQMCLNYDVTHISY